MNDPEFARRMRRLVGAWLALIALMLASLGSAYLALGVFKPIAGIAIATLKSAIVLGLFMQLAKASGMVRIVAAAGLFTWALLIALSGVDYATRQVETAAMQTPQQVQPLRGVAGQR